MVRRLQNVRKTTAPNARTVRTMPNTISKVTIDSSIRVNRIAGKQMPGSGSGPCVIEGDHIL